MVATAFSYVFSKGTAAIFGNLAVKLPEEKRKRLFYETNLVAFESDLTQTILLAFTSILKANNP